MTITTANTYEKIELAIRSVAYPTRPAKPQLPLSNQHTPAILRAQADALESYEQVKAEYERRLANYHAEKVELENVWRNKLREEYSNLNDTTFNIVYNMAWERGHSSGYSEVRSYMDDLDTFATSIIKANK